MFQYSSFLLFLFSTDMVLSQPDLCQNPKIDSIEWISDQKMYFFTSGGYYWIIKYNELPPSRSKGKPLPGGFKKGESAVYLNTLIDCKSSMAANKHSEQQIYVSEMTPKGHELIIYDIRDNKWSATPESFSNNKIISPAGVSVRRKLDAMFIRHPSSELFVIQGNRYAGVNYLKLCHDKNAFTTAVGAHNLTELHIKDQLDASTLVGDTLYLFFGDQYWTYKTDGSTLVGQVRGNKIPIPLSIKTDFFKYLKDCSNSETVEPSSLQSELTSHSFQPTDIKGVTDDSNSGKGEAAQNKSESEGNSILAIIGIVILLIIISAFGLLIVLAVFRESKPKDKTNLESAKKNTVRQNKSSVKPKAQKRSTNKKR